MVCRTARVAFALTAIVWSQHSWAAKPYGMAGCGLGSIIISPSGNQSSAATTNGSAYNQMFGITSGTSNCKPSAETAAIMDQEQFVQTNLPTLSKEMAQGSGESLVAFSEKLGCAPAAFPTFASHLQANYEEIMAAPGAMAILDATKSSLATEPTLAKGCQHLSI